MAFISQDKTLLFTLVPDSKGVKKMTTLLKVKAKEFLVMKTIPVNSMYKYPVDFVRPPFTC
jgi:hypothetical protein